MIATVTVTVPGTTANLGPGFDCIGAALTLCNQFKFSLLPARDKQVVITVNGLEAKRVGTDARNLVYQSFERFYGCIGRTPPPVHIEIKLGVPLARGLGSSATAIVGGLVGANILAGSPLDQEALLQMAIEIEGHPDNVVPALLGGCRLAATGVDADWSICEIPWDRDIVPVVAIPDFELSTQAARRVLPTDYSRADAIFNMAHLGVLIRGLETGRGEWLRAALQDRLHQPYRQGLIPGYEAIRSAALSAGAYGVVISGAGPTLLSLASADTAPAIKLAVANAWAKENVSAEVHVLRVNFDGTITATQDEEL